MSRPKNKLAQTAACAGEHVIAGSPQPSREEVATFLFAHPDRVLRGVRGKVAQLEGSRRGSLAYINTDDLLATVIVRIDRAVLAGLVRTNCEAEFWAYVRVTGENAVLELLRSDKSGRLRSLELCRITPAPPALRVAVRDAQTKLVVLLAAAPTDSDRRLLSFKARGLSYKLIAAATGRSQQTLRKQWSQLRKFFRQQNTHAG